jgi:hypothetical protein
MKSYSELPVSCKIGSAVSLLGILSYGSYILFRKYKSRAVPKENPNKSIEDTPKNPEMSINETTDLTLEVEL